MSHEVRRCLSALCVLVLMGPAWEVSAASHFTEVPGNPLGLEAEWSNYVRLADLDGDRDLDVIIPNCGGFFKNPKAEAFRIYRNDGTFSFVDATASMLSEAWEAPVRVVAIGDVDSDGDVDLFTPSAGGLPDRLYINDGKGSFSQEAGVRFEGGRPSSNAAAARFADVDGDGDLDLIVGGGYAVDDSPPVYMYENDGTGRFSDVSSRLPSVLVGMDPDDIDVFDADGDFDLDILVNAHAGANGLWLNDGKGTFADASDQLAPPGTGSNYHYGPSVCDVDGDGDLDMWVDNTGGGYREQLLINDGSGRFADETDARVTGNVGADDNQVLCVDVDHDGDFDAVIASLSGNERILLNDGTGNFTALNEGFSTVSDPTLWLDVGDLDGDGALDVVTVQGEGSPARNRVYTGMSRHVDERPPMIRASQTLTEVAANRPVVFRFAVSDAVVSDSGPRLETAFVKVAMGGQTVVAGARYVGGDLFQATIDGAEDGTLVTLTPCAVDVRSQEGCGAEVSYTVGQSQTGAGGASANGSSTTSTGAGGASEPPFVPDSGGCRLARISGQGTASVFWLLCLAMLVVRRKDRCDPARRSSSSR